MRKEGFNWEVSVGVTFASFMSAVTLFFTGMLIAQYNSFDSTIRVALLFLIISTFSFIFSASIYSNAGIEVTAGKVSSVKKYLIYANNIFEFLGLYTLLIATPLVISSITSDGFLRLSTIVVAISGLVLYSQSSFSILHKEVASRIAKVFYTALIALLAVVLYIYQRIANSDFEYKLAGALLLLTLISITIFSCLNSKQYKEF